MPRYIIKLQDKDNVWYMEWSSIVDAPVTYGMSLEEFKQHYQEEYGARGMAELETRLKRVEATGTSSLLHESLDRMLVCNRAGPNEKCISKEEIIERFCRNIPKEDK